MRTPRLEYHWSLFLLEHLLDNTASMRRKEQQMCFQALQVETTKATAPEHPSVYTLLGSMDTDILNDAEQVYQEECVVAPSVLPY